MESGRVVRAASPAWLRPHPPRPPHAGDGRVPGDGEPEGGRDRRVHSGARGHAQADQKLRALKAGAKDLSASPRPGGGAARVHKCSRCVCCITETKGLYDRCSRSRGPPSGFAAKGGAPACARAPVESGDPNLDHQNQRGLREQRRGRPAVQGHRGLLPLLRGAGAGILATVLDAISAAMMGRRGRPQVEGGEHPWATPTSRPSGCPGPWWTTAFARPVSPLTWSRPWIASRPRPVHSEVRLSFADGKGLGPQA